MQGVLPNFITCTPILGENVPVELQAFDLVQRHGGRGALLAVRAAQPGTAL